MSDESVEVRETCELAVGRIEFVQKSGEEYVRRRGLVAATVVDGGR